MLKVQGGKEEDWRLPRKKKINWVNKVEYDKSLYYSIEIL